MEDLGSLEVLDPAVDLETIGEVPRFTDLKAPILPNQDYNLNSPLIIDHIQAAINFLKIGRLDPRFSQREPELKQLADGIDRLRIRLKDIKEPSYHHSSIPQLIYSNDPLLTKQNPADRWWDVFFLTLGPLSATLEYFGIKNQDVLNYHDRLVKLMESRLEAPIQKEWKSFINFHFIVHLMNQNKEIKDTNWPERILHLRGWKRNPLDKLYVLSLPQQTPIWVVSPNFAFHLPSLNLYDKNFILMFKDVCLARVMSQLSLENRTDRPIEDRTIRVLRRVYDYGDQILLKFGSKAYKALKLLEAFCTERWNQLGHQHRPLIPLSDLLAKHLDKSLSEMGYMEYDARLFIGPILEETDPWIIAQVYGGYRHWGHPYINYQEGLQKLRARVNEPIEVDDSYAQELASDLAYIILRDQFKKKKRWFASVHGLDTNNPIRKAITENMWPTPKVIEDYGPNWHKLDLLPCFDIPDSIDMGDLYSDKAHSLQRDQVHEHITNTPNRPIPAKRVMETLLTTENPNIPEFLKKIDEEGLDWNDRVIGLKAKERELKDEGRYFALMSWNMRLYFVVTEYLIKKHFVPLFSGLTVADDLTTMTKKLIQATEGQGLDDYEKIYIANEIDYEKWNNRHRKSSNCYVFEVMGKFLGFKTLISRTHEIFETSLIYYNDRPDLMWVDDGVVTPKDPNFCVSWEGQLGGLEGLRQKGWSILNYLVLRREALTRNTGTRFLAQGDNQVVITQYHLITRMPSLIEDELKNVWRNNLAIMTRIKTATERLGLTINEDEVVTSAELLIYGKIPVFRGKVLPLETKRWSRISTVTNDQLPSLANSIAGSTTNALAVNQYNDHPTEVIRQHHFFSGFACTMLTYVNPILGYDPFKWKKTPDNIRKLIVLRLIYKDPSVGGVCGTNYLRFFISRFPDPVTESLTWWRIIYHRTNDKETRHIALEIGNPHFGVLTNESRAMLLEDPTSLNIPGGLSSETLIKNKIKEGLTMRAREEDLKNSLVREALIYSDDHCLTFVNWLFQIKPIFPRFLSEFYTATYFKIADSVLSVFQNSRTIRKSFSKTFSTQVVDVIKKAEAMSINGLRNPKSGHLGYHMWECSATKADDMRKQSWGTEIVGVTTPHPAEFLTEKLCTRGCNTPHLVAKKEILSNRKPWTKGYMTPYLGSKTKESTNMIHPWEKHLEVPLLRKACNLRKVICWFVNPDSNLASSIYNNLESLTGLNFEEELVHFKRTGSSKHRLHCSRVSHEGNPAIGFNNLMYVTVTTDALGELNESNHDFMYQTLLCWAGILAVLPGSKYENNETTHFHIEHKECIREIKEDILDSPTVYTFEDRSKVIKSMITQDIKQKYLQRTQTPTIHQWKEISDVDKSWHIGRAQGFEWGLAVFNGSVEEVAESLFSTTITRKVNPTSFLEGVHRGFLLGATLPPIFSRYGSLSEKARLRFEGAYWDILERALTSSKLASMINHEKFTNFLTRTGSDVIKSYPATANEIATVLKRWFLKKLILSKFDRNRWSAKEVVFFADMNTEYLIGMFRIAERLLPAYQFDRLSTKSLTLIRDASKMIVQLSQFNESNVDETTQASLTDSLRKTRLPKFFLVPSETRHAASTITTSYFDTNIVAPLEIYGEPEGLGCDYVKGDFIPAKTNNWETSLVFKNPVPQIRCTLFSSVRVVQYSTGAHYKYKDLDRDLRLEGDGIFCGDGSGGMGANHLRKYGNSRVIFNSKLKLEGESLKGLAPSGPGAYTVSGSNVMTRCVNYNTCWEEPSDLSNTDTWDNFIQLRVLHDLKIRVLCCDAEVQDESITDKIEDNILNYLPHLLPSTNGILIYKTYFHRLQNVNSLPHRVGLYFHKVTFCMPRSQGSFTSEFYVVGEFLKEIENPTQTELTEATIMEIGTKCRVFSTPEAELIRARSFYFLGSIRGLEPRIPFQSLEDSSLFLNSLGIEAGISLKMADILEKQVKIKLHPFSIMWILGYLISKNVISPTTWYTPGTFMPSSHKLQKMIAGLFGIWFMVCLLTNDVDGFKNVLAHYQKPVPISFGLREAYHKSTKTSKRTYITWTIGEGQCKKVIDPGPRAGVTQQIGRFIFTLYKGQFTTREFDQSDIDITNTLLKMVLPNINMSVITKRTGIPYSKLGNPITSDTPVFEQATHLETPMEVDLADKD